MSCEASASIAKETKGTTVVKPWGSTFSEAMPPLQPLPLTYAADIGMTAMESERCERRRVCGLLHFLMTGNSS